MIYFLAAFSVVLLVLFMITATVIGLNMAVIRQPEEKNGEEENDDNYKNYISEGRRWLDRHTFEEQTVTSFDGKRLYGRFFRNGDSKTTLIMMHGFRSTADHDFSCAFSFYFDKGFNLLVPDQRSHGKSEGKYITFGVLESRDVVSWAEHINRLIPDGKLYIIGISMGASTVLTATALPLPENVCGIIADCGFTGPGAIIKKVMKEDLKVPLFPFYYTTRAAARLMAGFDFEEKSVVNAVKDCRIPILFLHGKSDGFVPFSMGEEIYNAAGGEKRAVWVEGADHGCSFVVDRAACAEALSGFLKI